MQLTPDGSLFVGRTTVHRVYLGSTQIWPAGTPEFAPLTVGGGGWVTGLAGKGDRLYARTDVGGAYRYDRPSRSWSQMIAATGVTLDPRENDYQVEALACAPSNPDVVYAAVGDGLGVASSPPRTRGGRGRSAHPDGGTSRATRRTGLPVPACAWTPRAPRSPTSGRARTVCT